MSGVLFSVGVCVCVRVCDLLIVFKCLWEVFVWGVVLVVCVCVSMSGVLFFVGVCVCECDLLIFLHVVCVSGVLFSVGVCVCVTC